MVCRGAWPSTCVDKLIVQPSGHRRTGSGCFSSNSGRRGGSGSTEFACLWFQVEGSE